MKKSAEAKAIRCNEQMRKKSAEAKTKEKMSEKRAEVKVICCNEKRRKKRAEAKRRKNSAGAKAVVMREPPKLPSSSLAPTSLPPLDTSFVPSSSEDKCVNTRVFAV